jgi:type IV pilus assembly protein PilY1
MSRHPLGLLTLAVLSAAWIPAASASSDEAWLARAALPSDIQPLLVMLVDPLAALSETLRVPAAYDPAFDYGASLPAATRCDAARAYWRRGPGPAPDCASTASVPLAAGIDAGFSCAAGHGALREHGLFVAARAAQWQTGPGGGGWLALRAGTSGPVECRADRGRHGATEGNWFAAQGGAGPWSARADEELDWDAAPLGDSYLFFSGNYLNYLATTPRSRELTVAEWLTESAAIAASAMEGLELDRPRTDAAVSLEAALATLRERLSGAGSDFTHACRPVSLAVLTDAAPRSCVGDNCLPALLAALSSDDLVNSLPGQQSLRAWLLGIEAPAGPLAEAAQAAKTTPLDLADPLALVMLMAHALQRDAGLPAGERLSAAAFSPGSAGLHEPQAFFGQATPQALARWPGNLQRYPLGEGPAAATVTPDSAAWPGGAAANLPTPAARRLYTDLAGPDLAAPANALAPGNVAITREQLGLNINDPVMLDDLLGWARGVDTFDHDFDGDRAAPRLELGDPGLQAPVVLRYAGAPSRSVMFVATGDGLLQAIDAASGVEAWAFMPAKLLGRLRDLADAGETRVRRHPAQGGLRLWLEDRNGDNQVDAAADERARLYVAFSGDGGGHYAIDVSTPARPQLLWSLGAAERPELGEITAPIVLARMRLDERRQHASRQVAIISGGYDPLQRARAAGSDAVGGRLLIVDAVSGVLLFQAAGAAAAGVDLVHPELEASVAAMPRALDVDGDGYIDRIYLLDVSGRLWRFDFPPGADPAEPARARLLARLGTRDNAPAARDARRFHAAPDIVYLRDGPAPRLVLAFGSGWAERPRDTSIADRFYTLFDSLPGAADAAADSTITDEDLFDAGHGIPPPADARGWYLRLDRHGPGEKTWGTALTLDHRLRFTTYQPLPPDPDAPCGPPRGTSRLYTLDIRSGAAVNRSSELDEPSIELPDSTPPPPLRIAFPAVASGCSGARCRDRPTLLIGSSAYATDFMNDPVKTSWRRLESPAD